ncbi:hypothetical protein BM1_03234 [Bipolaris maydis]|nr:hypothetical protein BM1_03234 [Bipolaris maydis]
MAKADESTVNVCRCSTSYRRSGGRLQLPTVGQGCKLNYPWRLRPLRILQKMTMANGEADIGQFGRWMGFDWTRLMRPWG